MRTAGRGQNERRAAPGSPTRTPAHTLSYDNTPSYLPPPTMSEMTVSSINDRAAEEFYRKGLDAEKDGNQEKAAELFERSLNENPDHELAAFRLAVLYDRRGEDAKAIELYERGCPGPPGHLKALLDLAIPYRAQNQH